MHELVINFTLLIHCCKQIKTLDISASAAFKSWISHGRIVSDTEALRRCHAWKWGPCDEANVCWVCGPYGRKRFPKYAFLLWASSRCKEQRMFTLEIQCLNVQGWVKCFAILKPNWRLRMFCRNHEGDNPYYTVECRLCFKCNSECYLRHWLLYL